MKAIGNTPLVKLKKIITPEMADVYVKLESCNPTGSMKDRMALSMIEGAENRGELKPGGTVVEYTGGSTGSSLAMVCAAKGYMALFVSSDAFAEEKLRTMQAFGAHLELIQADEGKITATLIDRLVQRAGELSKQPNSFWTDQFNNLDNKKAYNRMAEEILAEIGTVDGFTAGVGTGACFSGNSEILKKVNSETLCIPLEPNFVRALSGGDVSGTHKLEGIGAGFIPSICRMDLADDVMAVRDEDAIEMARKLACEEGIFGGTTSGANVWAALRLAEKLGAGKKVVTVICDSGLKYLKGNLYRF